MTCRQILLGLTVAMTCVSVGLTNELTNPGFEETTADRLTTWTPYGRGYALEATEVQSGQRAVCCATESDQDGTGIAQVIRYDEPDRANKRRFSWISHVASSGSKLAVQA